MAANITAPKDKDAAVVLLPDTQLPYGANCEVDRDVQSVFFHYGLRKEDVDVLVKEGFTSIERCQWADPDGDDDARETFQECVADHIRPKLFIRPVKAALRRINSDDPFAAVVAAPPSKRAKIDDIVAAVVDSASSKSVKSKTGASSSSKVSPKSSSSSSSKSSAKASSKSGKNNDVSASESSASDTEAGDADNGSSAGIDLLDLTNLPCIPGTSSKAKDLNQLFSAVGTEVSLSITLQYVDIL